MRLDCGGPIERGDGLVGRSGDREEAYEALICGFTRGEPSTLLGNLPVLAAAVRKQPQLRRELEQRDFETRWCPLTRPAGSGYGAAEGTKHRRGAAAGMELEWPLPSHARKMEYLGRARGVAREQSYEDGDAARSAEVEPACLCGG